MTDPRKPIFSAVKDARGGKPYSEGDVAALDAVLDGLGVPKSSASGATGLADAAAFYAAVRAANLFGDEQPQVDGINFLLDACGAAGWPISFTAYALATASWETNKTMQPVREAYWLSETWRKKNLRYWPWYGRGYVQLTWEANYRRADEELGLNGALVADKDLAMDCEIAAKIMVKGMAAGWFTGKKLSDYLPLTRPAAFDEFRHARRIINGTDRATEIANVALRFQAALQDGGWQ